MQVSKIRKRKKLSQTELGELVGVEQPTISRLERGDESVTLRLINNVAAALDSSPSELLADDREIRELQLIEAFRQLSPERQDGWLDLASAISVPRTQPEPQNL